MMVDHHLAAVTDRPPLTEVALCAWVGQAYPGDQLVYHHGFLAIDTGADNDVVTPAERQRLQRLAARGRQLSEQGLVHLLQRREAPGEYTYLIVVRPRPRAAGGSLRAVREQAGLANAELPAKRRA